MQVLHQIPDKGDPNILAGIESADDAAVYRLGDDIAIVESTDFFTPIVDDPYTFGRIAAANALSDIYAMGARPLFALNLVGFPAKKLPAEVLESILKGGADMAEEAGIEVVGGHSIDDPEPKYGMVVTGTVHPERIVRNSTAREGDYLILTKPLGTGIITTALKRGFAGQAAVDEAVDWMLTLNREASEVMVDVGVSAATDVTGFGLLGHLIEMLSASGVGAKIETSKIPVMDEVYDYLSGGAYPAGSAANLEFVTPDVEWDDGVSDETRKILCDAQTSGGLLISVPEQKRESLLVALGKKGVFNVTIGRLTRESPGRAKVME